MVRRRTTSSRRGAWGVLIGFLVLIAAAAAVVLATLWSGATLAADATALARAQAQPFGGSIVGAQALTPSGQRIALSVSGGRLTPVTAVTPGERLSVSVTFRRPSWISWAVGSEHTVRLTVLAPVANVSSRWLTVERTAPVRVPFDRPVSAIAYGSPGHLVRQTLSAPQRVVTLLTQQSSGSVLVAAAARTWERLSTPVPVTWFPPSTAAGLIVSPAPGAQLPPGAPIRLTFSKPVRAVLGTSVPALVPATPGTWKLDGDHTLVFTPSGLGLPFSTDLRALLPRAVAVATATGAQTLAELRWSTPRASTLRLQQLLAQAGYLPVDWTASGPAVARTAAAQVRAAVAPPAGTFGWRYPNTPRELQALWSQGDANMITRGAVMTFEHTHGLDVDGIAGPMVWHALLADTLAGKRRATPYSYVFVHENVPQLLTLWSAGHTVLTSPGNTGIASRPTKRGTFPVFEHISVGTMSGTNPDGSHYHDPGIRWISYFNGGDAIHAFTRASFGTPQSLGCVELPLASAAKVWPYTPIGTLVTVES